VCLVDHVSGTYATDLADGKWVVVIDGDVVLASLTAALNVLIAASDAAMQAQVIAATNQAAIASNQAVVATNQANAAALSAAAAAASAALAATITGLPAPSVPDAGKVITVSGAGTYTLQAVQAPPVFVLNDQGII
jgi:hypothetical protein